MITFFFKHKPIVFDAFTNRVGVYNTAKIGFSSQFYPDWWKALPKQTDGVNSFPKSTMKTCEGFLRLYQQGFVLPLWSDVFINIDESRNYSWQFADNISRAEVHMPREAGDFFVDNFIGNLKLMSPWALRTKASIPCYLSGAVWNIGTQKGFVIPPGVVDYSKNASTNINMLLDLGQPRSILLEFGTPMMQIIPITERPITIKHHIVNDDEFSKVLFPLGSVAFINSYRKAVKSMEKNT